MKKNLGTLLWGLFFIAVGIGYLGNAFDFWDFRLFFSGWWTLFIIIPCLISMVQSGVGFGNLFGAAIGVTLLLSEQNLIPKDVVGKMFFPIILVGIGAAIIFHTFRSPKTKVASGKTPDLAAIFGSQEYRYSQEPFFGATITAVFGGIELDLTQADIKEDVMIDVTTVFGGADIRVPNNVKVKVESLPIFGGVSNKAITSQAEDAPTVLVKCFCAFGGVDIK